MNRRIPRNSALAQIEWALLAFAEAGLGPAAQAVVYHTLHLHVLAYCLWEIEELNRGGDLAEPARVAALNPHTAAAITLIFTPDPDRQFEAGLDLIIRGLQVRKER